MFQLNRVECLHPDSQFSLQGLSLAALVRLAEALDVPLPEIDVLGFLPERLAWSTELSPIARRGLDEALACVHRLLEGIASPTQTDRL